VPLPVRARPREGDYDPVATRLDEVEAVGAVGDFPPLRYPPSENLTGLVGAASGGRPQGLPQPAAAPPLHVRVDQRDERLYVTFAERLVRVANRVNGHRDSVLQTTLAYMPAVQLESVITCPLCGHQAREQMPTDACQFFYVCTGCDERLRPAPGDCCVFCSFGTTAMPAEAGQPLIVPPAPLRHEHKRETADSPVSGQALKS
jgi:hypothetical protein